MEYTIKRLGEVEEVLGDYLRITYVAAASR
jgi:hypothetical protein